MAGSSRNLATDIVTERRLRRAEHEGTLCFTNHRSARVTMTWTAVGGQTKKTVEDNVAQDIYGEQGQDHVGRG